MRVLTFDLGDTLAEYEGLPLSWEDHYPAALKRLATFLEVRTTQGQEDEACAVLRRYNTRLVPRETEPPFAQLLGELCAVMGAAPPADPAGAAGAFFAVFRQRLRPFPDAHPTLAALKAGGARVAVFTDVPYAMPRSLVLEDLAAAGLGALPDLVATSGDVGFRKPSPRTLAYLAGQLGCGPAEMTYVGNEEKDVRAAQAFGCAAVLLVRGGPPPAWGQGRTIASLAELLDA
jgi:putative hydrolase of the HAD superfamily